MLSERWEVACFAMTHVFCRPVGSRPEKNFASRLQTKHVGLSSRRTALQAPGKFDAY